MQINRKDQQICVMKFSGNLDNGAVYQIVCTETGERYIGITSWLRRRLHGHISCLRRGRHVSKGLQAAFDEYGEASFLAGVIQSFDTFPRRKRPKPLLVRQMLILENAYLRGCTNNWNTVKTLAKPRQRYRDKVARMTKSSLGYVQ